MTTSIAVMTANLMRVAANHYNDATGFVAILQQNNFTDYRINDPVVVNTVVPCVAGQQTLLFPPTVGIQLGDYVYCNGLASCSVVIGVTQNYSVPSSPYCACPLSSQTVTIIPPQGDVVNTVVTIAPGLDVSLAVGSAVTFTIGTQTTIVLPDVLPLDADGVPT
jgi:hypothetical protein